MKLFQITLLGSDVGWDGDDDEIRPAAEQTWCIDASAIVQRGRGDFHPLIYHSEKLNSEPVMSLIDDAEEKSPLSTKVKFRSSATPHGRHRMKYVDPRPLGKPQAVGREPHARRVMR